MSHFAHRGVMLDPARLMEKKDYYESLLPWLKEWGYNILHLHVSDDQGLTVQLPSHPDLSKPMAYTPEEMKDFIQTADAQGITVIPELESLGHTGFITSHPDYQGLGASKDGGFNSLHPKKKAARTILKDLLEDIVSIFPSEVIHAGLDEVDMSGIPEFSKLSRNEQWKEFTTHAKWVHETIRKLGRRPAMWGDHMLRSPEMAKAFKRDVLVFDWHYDAPFDPKSITFFLDHGYEVWGAPASMQWNQRILPSVSNQFQNLREFSAWASPLRERGCTGMVNTIWCPYRYLSGVMDLPMAFGGHVFSEEAEQDDFCESFAKSFYGLKKAAARDAGRLIWQMHEITPQLAWGWDRLILGTNVTREDCRTYAAIGKEAAKIEKALKPLVKKATRHASRLHDYILSARIYQWFGAYAAANGNPSALKGSKKLLASLETSWNRTKDEPWDIETFPLTHTDKLLPTIKYLASRKA